MALQQSLILTLVFIFTCLSVISEGMPTPDCKMYPFAPNCNDIISDKQAFNRFKRNQEAAQLIKVIQVDDIPSCDENEGNINIHQCIKDVLQQYDKYLAQPEKE